MNKFEKYIQGSKKVLLITSQPLDFDCISSGIILAKYIESQGIDVTLRFPREITEEEIKKNKHVPFFNELKGEDTRELINEGNYDTLILLDGTNWVQFYDYINNLLPMPVLDKTKKIILIDHHLGNPEDITKFQIKDSKASATIEIILSKIIPASFLNEQLATLAYIGLMGDTGNFRWNFNANTLKQASNLIKKGAKPLEAIEHMFFMKSKDYVEAMKYVLDNIEYDTELKTLFLFLPKEKIINDNLDDQKYKLVKDVYVNEFSNNIDGYHRGIFMAEREEKIKITARASNFYNKINLPELWKTFGGNGGGHFNAAGMLVEGDFTELKKLIKKEIKSRLV